jgi:flagellin
MQEVQDMLNRMVTLATQSANGTYDEDVDRANLQKEVDQLTSEINRIADSSNFNGIKLLDGSLDGSRAAGTQVMDLSSALTDVVARTDTTDATAGVFTVNLDGFTAKVASGGAGANDTVATLTVGGKTISLEVSQALTSGDTFALTDLTISDADITIDDITYTLTLNAGVLLFNATDAPTAVSQIIQDQTVSISPDASKITADGGAKINGAIQIVTAARVQAPGGEATAKLTLSKDMLTKGSSIKIGSQTFTLNFDTVYDPTSTATDIGVKGLLDEKGNITDEGVEKVAARITKAAAGSQEFTIGADGKTLTIQSKTSNNNTGANNKLKLDLSTVDKVKEQFSVTTSVEAGQSLSLQIGDTSDSYNQLSVSIQDIHASSLKIDSISISTQTDAQDAINSIKDAINTVSSVRGTLGATQNRLEHTSNNLSVMTENIQDAESTIRDTDIAEEMMSYTKNSILVQSAQAMLAQANTVPQGVLQLLQ